VSQVAIVTGANRGIGYTTCLELARKNAHVFLGARNEQSALESIAEIKKETGNDKVELLKLDLSELRSVKSAAQAFLASQLPLHIL